MSFDDIEGPEIGLVPSHPAGSASPHQCPVCFKTYKRREHLLRHSSSHTSERRHRCPVCNCSFQRTDVLRRHSRTCQGPNGTPRAAARKRACDRCARQKKACSGFQPCSNCSKKETTCTYSTIPKSVITDMSQQPVDMDECLSLEALVHRNPMPTISAIDGMAAPSVEEDGQFENLDMAVDVFGTFSDPHMPGVSSPTWQGLLPFQSGSQAEGETDTAMERIRRYRFDFLDRFTSQTGFILSFDCGTLRQRQELMSHIQCEMMACGPRQTTISSLAEAANTALLDGVSSNWLNEPLALKTHEILLLVKEVVTVKPRNSAVTLSWSPNMEQACLKFFSPLNLRKFIEFYWAMWAPNVNFVHRPAFDAASSKSILVAAMALIGACVSPDPMDNEDARTWLNCVEEMVFIDEDFNSDPAYPFNPCANRRKIQALQASYMVCLYQNWEGTDASKKRIRRSRYGTVVSMARDMDITTARHLNYCLQGRHEFVWNEFVAREEIIRIFLWIFLLDTAFVIFNNLPPRLVIKEMKEHVAAPEACFQAETADKCFRQIQQWMPARSPFWKMTFRSSFENLCQGKLTTETRYVLAALGPLNLFAMTSAIHSLIFQYQNSFGGGQLLQRIRHALSNWKDTWHTYTAIFPGSHSPHTLVDSDCLQPEYIWKRVGFCRFSPDYWLLASLKVERLASVGAAQSRGDVRLSPGNERDLLDDDDESSDPILNKYDQTSMRQVNDLISEFQRVQIH